MKVELELRRRDEEQMQEWRYRYAVTLEKASLEEVEAHVRNVVRILDEQAQAGEEDDDATT